MLARLQKTFRDVFEDDELVVGPETTAADVDAWDSLMHVTLIVNVEREFGVRFASSEIAHLKDVGELLALIEAKVAK